MHKQLGDARLKTGERIVINVVRTPDCSYGENIRAFLPHLDEIWQWHLGLALRGQLDELETRFYLGILNGRIIGNVSTWEHRSLGILGHVYTAEDQRRKGVFNSLVKACLQDFRDRGGKITVLGTPVDAPWNHVYRECGFADIAEGSEVMRCDLDPDFQKTFLQSKKIYSREVKWSDWPSLSILYTVQEGWLLRSMRYSVFGPLDYEDHFLHDMKRTNGNECQVRVLVTEEEHVVGHSTLSFLRREEGPVWLLDFFVHSVHVSGAACLLDSLHWPTERVRCYVEEDNREKMSVLSGMGFHRELLSLKQITHEGKKIDILAMEKGG